MLLLLLAVVVSAAPFGQHNDNRLPDCEAVSVDTLSPHAFFEHYVVPERAVLLKGAAAALLEPSARWNDDAYLAERHGALVVEVEVGKREERGHPVLERPLATFLREYLSADLYVVHDVPPEMRRDLRLLPVLQRGGYANHLDTAVLWFSSGNTRSVLHHDETENVICLLDGEKQFTLLPATPANMEAIVDDFYRQNNHSSVNVDDVNITAHPGLARAAHSACRMYAGDCLYVPQHMFHQVNSAPGRNLAVNLWWHRFTVYNDTPVADPSYASLQWRPVPAPQEELDESEHTLQQLLSEALPLSNDEEPLKRPSVASDGFPYDFGEEPLTAEEEAEIDALIQREFGPKSDKTKDEL